MELNLPRKLKMHTKFESINNNNIKRDLLLQATTLLQLKKNSEAISLYSKGVLLFPNDGQMHYCLGVALHQNGQILEAIKYYCRAIELEPKLIEAFENLSEAQFDLKLFEDSLISIRAALEIDPQKAINHSRLARILTQLNKYDAAISAASYSIAINPQIANTYMVRSIAHRQLNQLTESILDLQKAINLDPNKAEYSYNMSFDLLLSEQFEIGWDHYESRFKTKNFILDKPYMVSPKWNGKDTLDGKTILVYPEQGLGDQIQFSRYALLLRELGAKVILPVDPPLVEVMQSVHPDILVTTSNQPSSSLPQHHYHIPLMSLMGIFKTTTNNIPFADRYLTTSKSMKEKWTHRLCKGKRPQIGITWSGSQVHINDNNRSMSLAQLDSLFNLDVDWHILQTDVRPADELLLPQKPLKDWRSELTSLHETAGLLDQLDLLISVDTSVAHLSAALGKPTWIMLPFAPDFRWLLNRTDSPWYQSVQLFRQPKPQDWTSVVNNIREKLSSK